MSVKNIINLLKKNKTVLKTDRSHLKAEKNRINNAPVADINYSVVVRYTNDALTDVRNMKVIEDLHPVFSNNPVKNESLTLNKYHIYSKKHLIKLLNKDAQNKQLTFHSIANSLSMFKYPSTNSDTVYALISNQVNNIKHSKYRYYLVDALDNTKSHIPVSYVIYMLTDLIDKTSREIQLARTNTGKALVVAYALKNSIQHNHSLKYNRTVMHNLLALSNQSQLKQTVNFVFKELHITPIPELMDGLLHLYHNSSNSDSTILNNVSDLKKLVKHGHTLAVHNLKHAKFVAFNIDKFLTRVINHLNELLKVV